MAVTKIHPIKTTLKKAIDYICNGDKTDDEIYVTTHLCSRENAHKEFEITKKQFSSRTKILAHHLIQSFVPEEVSFEEAHQVGIELCEKILEGKYEYVLATHIDKDHIHNHIIFNSIDVDEGKVYHSYYGSYMNIRNQSDKLCKEHNLSVIDQETQREINEIKRRKFVSWHDWNEDKKGSSYKSKLQFDIDRSIQKSVNWQDFLCRMESNRYEIKFGKHIAFRSKNQQRFTRAKTIGGNYTEERIKDRILNKEKELGNIIDIKNNEKVKSSKEYERWATKHNMTTAANTMIVIRDKGFHSMKELESEIKRLSSQANQLRKEFRDKEFELKRIEEIMKHLQTCVNKKDHYDGYRKNTNDKIYMMMNRKDVEAYKEAFSEVEVFIKQFPHLKKEIMEGLKRGDGKSIFKELNQHSKSLYDKQKELAEEHYKLREKRSELELLKTNINQYLGRREEPKKSIIQQIKRESDKSQEIKSNSRTKDMER
jgi:hypothetical protein